MKLPPRFAALATVAGTLLFSGCYQVPVTGRHAISMVDDKEVTKMSIAAFDDMKAHTPISRDKERTAQLQRVGERLQRTIPIWDMPDADWEFVLFDSQVVTEHTASLGALQIPREEYLARLQNALEVPATFV